jgi:hypothetical protein
MAVAVLVVWCGGVRLSILTAQTSSATPGAIRTYSTISSIGIEWDIVGDADHDATAVVEFRVAGTTAWRSALPLVRVDYNGSNMLAGSILFLSPNGIAIQVQDDRSIGHRPQHDCVSADEFENRAMTATASLACKWGERPASQPITAD